MKYIDTLLPLPLNGYFTYVLPASMMGKAKVGMRVVVPFGTKKLYTAMIVRLHNHPPAPNIELKEPLELLDSHGLVTQKQLDFWIWLADYYMCAMGEVFKAALPSGLKLESESIVTLTPRENDPRELTTKEEEVVLLLRKKNGQRVTDLQKASRQQNILPTLHQLLEKGILTLKEELLRSYKPRTETHVRLKKAYCENKLLAEWFESQKQAPKRVALLTHYLQLSKAKAALSLANPSLLVEVEKQKLLQEAGTSSAILNLLITQGVFETYPYEIGRLDTSTSSVVAQMPLSETQEQAYAQILASFEQKPICLLHGVTSSGKTEVYIRLIQRELEAGRQVLYLVPEIALTTQITTRLSRIFGNKMGVYHSKFPDAERVEIWKKQSSEHPYQLLLGVRSSLLLPFNHLGLIIVDEEHETSYKQQDPAPRYNARDAALLLAHQFGANTLLGTATPSLESYANAKNGKYGLVCMTTRFGEVQLPKIEVVDVKELRRKKSMKSPFSPRLIEEIQHALDHQKQVILFQNRRGYSPIMECHKCGWVPRCQQCDVSLTYHREQQRLVCHYCGRSYQVPTQCPSCEETDLRNLGYGTEKIEEQIHQLFPTARTARMDLDTTRSRLAYESMITNFQQGHTDILIGTQMVTKGLDFKGVKVVGILDADTMLNQPDFRSYERSFQMMSQVSGRAGRRETQGLVLLQTKQKDLAVIQQVVNHDYAALFAEQMEERKLFHYPPYYRLTAIYLKHRDAHLVEEAAQTMGNRLRFLFGERVLGPDRPAVARIQLQYIRKILLKVERGAPMKNVRKTLLAVQQEVLAMDRYKAIHIYFDVDPL